MHMLNPYDSLIHSGFMALLKHSDFLTFLRDIFYSKPVHAICWMLAVTHLTIFSVVQFLLYALLRLFVNTYNNFFLNIDLLLSSIPNFKKSSQYSMPCGFLYTGHSISSFWAFSLNDSLVWMSVLVRKVFTFFFRSYFFFFS